VLPYTVNNARLLLPRVFEKEVCDRVLNQPAAKTGIQLVVQAIGASSGPLNCTRFGFSKAVKDNDSQVWVRMGVYTAYGWTEIAEVIIKRGRYATPQLDYDDPIAHTWNDENKQEVLRQIRAEMVAVNKLEPNYNSGLDFGAVGISPAFWRGVLDKTLMQTKQWAAANNFDELYWLQDMEASAGRFAPILPEKDGLTDVT